jgi:Mrp family chromosome partitioning ATPase
MERIKQALEIARQEREKQSGEAKTAQTPRQPATGSGSSQAAKSAAADKAPREIVYTQTRTLELNPAHLEHHRVVSGSEATEDDAYKLLRTQVLQRMRVNNWQTLAITSPNEGAGKTLTAINLAMSLAREVNQTVLLVDLDLRQPKIRDYLTEEPLKGIGDYLMDDVPLPELLFNPKGIERLVILPGSISFRHSSEMLSSPKVVALAEELKTRYPSRLVLFDMPPMLACDDVLAFSPHFDAALLVIEENVTSKQDIARSMDLLEQTNLLGTVLNKATAADMRYG